MERDVRVDPVGIRHRHALCPCEIMTELSEVGGGGGAEGGRSVSGPRRWFWGVGGRRAHVS